MRRASGIMSCSKVLDSSKSPVAWSASTPESLADYLIEVLRRAGQRFFSDVLDDPCVARDFFATRVDCKKLGFLAEFDLAKIMKRGTRARQNRKAP